jgi:hypothetical protein
LAAQTSYTKQALSERLNATIGQFLAGVATSLFGQLSGQLKSQGHFASFQRVLLHDSTVEPLPDHLAPVFAGPANRTNKRFASLKLQFVCDLLHAQVLHLSLSGFTRNDQAASPDILALVQKGDLIIRDLGYFVLKVFEQISLRHAYFLSRYRHGVSLHDPRTGQSINLKSLLSPGQCLDRQILLGREKIPVRLVALPLPQALVNERRRKARANRDRRLNPNAQRIYLLAWNIMITNVPRSIWSAKILQPIYRLRWRIPDHLQSLEKSLGLAPTQLSHRGFGPPFGHDKVALLHRRLSPMQCLGSYGGSFSTCQSITLGQDFRPLRRLVCRHLLGCFPSSMAGVATAPSLLL